MGLGRRRLPRQHERDWRRLWLYCRCGQRWVCPDSIRQRPYKPLVPPLTAAEYRAAMRASSPQPEVVRLPPIDSATFRAEVWKGMTDLAIAREAAAARSNPLVEQTAHAANNPWPLWNSASGSHEIGRVGALTPAQDHRGRYGERLARARRAGRM